MRFLNLPFCINAFDSCLFYITIEINYRILFMGDYFDCFKRNIRSSADGI